MKILHFVILLTVLSCLQAQTSTAPLWYQIAGNGMKCAHSTSFLLQMILAFRSTSYNLIDTLFYLYLRGFQFSNSFLLVLFQGGMFPYYVYNYSQEIQSCSSFWSLIEPYMSTSSST